ncbi:MAG TPA: HAD-IIIA family hydrolase [Bacillota bacterium]|nr:HAD-IIIA family hydrolase [Bacillota bacterium]
MQALILAGGMGTRLRSILPDLPKPLAPIGTKPFLLYILEQLKKYGIKEVIISVCYKADRIREVIGDGADIGLHVQYAIEEKPLGTGGALWNALPLFQEDSILVINGDTYFDINYQILKKYHGLWKAELTLALKYRENISRYGIVCLSRPSPHAEDNNHSPEWGGLYRVTLFHERPQADEVFGYINGGVYLINKDVVECLPRAPLSAERDIIPNLITHGVVYGLPMGGRFIDIGIPEDYRFAGENMQVWVRNTKYISLFLDRDGVINEDIGYLCRSKDVRFIPLTIEKIRLANRLGWKVCVVSNQAGVARGYYQEEDIRLLHQWMSETLEKLDAHIDRFYYCPHHSQGSIAAYKKSCLCRKPEPGLFLKAAEELDLILEKSVMVGDQPTDLIRLPYLTSRHINDIDDIIK